MPRFVKVTNLAGGVAHVNPEHVTLVGPHVEKGVPVVGVCTVLVNNPLCPPQVVRGSVEEVAALFADRPSLIGG